MFITFYEFALLISKDHRKYNLRIGDSFGDIHKILTFSNQSALIVGLLPSFVSLGSPQFAQ